MEETSAAVVFKDMNAQGGLEMWVEGVPGLSPLNGAAQRIYDIAQGFSTMPGMFCDPEGAMCECRINIADNGDGVKFSFDFGSGLIDDAPTSCSQQLVLKIMTEISNHLGNTTKTQA